MKKICLSLLLSGSLISQTWAFDAKQYFQNLNGFRADFHSLSQSSLDTNSRQQSNGKFALARPNRFSWSYETPNPFLLLSDGKTLYQYDPELKQVTQKPLSEINAPLMQLLAEKQSLNQIDMTALSEKTLKRRYPSASLLLLKHAKTFYQVSEKPQASNRSDSSHLGAQTILLGFNEKQQLSTIFSVEEDINSVFWFENIEENPTFQPAAFSLNVPDDVDIL